MNVNKIVCLIDFTDGSGLALKRALEIASPVNAQVTLVHMVEGAPAQQKNEDEHLSPTQAQEKAKAMLETFCREKAPDANCNYYVGWIQPGESTGKAIAKFARAYNADLIIAVKAIKTSSSKKGKTGIVNVLVDEAHCPVFLYRYHAYTQTDVLKGKKILVVDDEPDVLESLEEILDTSDTTTALDFRTADAYLDRIDFDAAILDIMGVDGFSLLEKCVQKNIPAIMLSAHAVTPNIVEKSIELGSVFFLPKNKMLELYDVLTDVILADGKPLWDKLIDRIDFYFDKGVHNKATVIQKINELRKSLPSSSKTVMNFWGTTK